MNVPLLRPRANRADRSLGILQRGRVSVTAAPMAIFQDDAGHAERIQPLCDIVPLVAEDSLGVSCTSDGECQNAAVCINGVCYVPKNRYLSIAANPGNAGLLTARRVSLETTGVGTIILGWVGPPNGNAIAYLQEEPEYRDWSLDESVIHVTECEIAPGETYLVQAILEGPSVGDESNYTAPLALPTAPVWGDVVSACPYDVCEPPQGDPFTQPNIDDVLALVNAFQGVENAPLTWLDVDPVVGNGCPEGTITIGDVLVVVNAFTGQPYPGDGPVDCP